MELMDIIRKRRSIRKYLDKKVEREKLDQIIEAGLFAQIPVDAKGRRYCCWTTPR